MNSLISLSLGTGAWDLVSFFSGAQNYAKLAGGGFLALIGVVALIVGGYKLVVKLMGGQNAQQQSWFTIGALVIVGGALMTGGFKLLADIGGGGETTVRDLGNGVIMPALQMLGF